MDDEWNLNGSNSSSSKIMLNNDCNNNSSHIVLANVQVEQNQHINSTNSDFEDTKINLNQLNRLIIESDASSTKNNNDESVIDATVVNEDELKVTVNVVESLMLGVVDQDLPNSNQSINLNSNENSLTGLLNSANLEEKSVDIVNETTRLDETNYSNNDVSTANPNIINDSNNNNNNNNNLNGCRSSNNNKNRFSYKCKNCSFLTKFKAHIIEHMQTEHKVNLMQCPNTNCNKKFKDEWKLKRHLKSSKDHPTDCQKFNDLNDCMKLYVEVKPLKLGLYPCPLCFISDPINQPNHIVYSIQAHQVYDFDKLSDNLLYLNSYDELRQHLSIKHPDFNPDSFIICKQCGQVFINRYKLSCHVFNVHSGKRKPRAKKSTANAATDLASGSSKKLKKSIYITTSKFLLPERKYTCVKCMRKFKRTRDLQIHIQIMHKDITEEEKQQTQLEIQKINQLLKSNSYHINHNKNYETVIKNETITNLESSNKICKICNKVFKSVNNVNINKSYIRHMQIQHGLNEKGERLIECPVCEKSFFNRQQLERHMHTHEVWVAIIDPVNNNTDSNIIPKNNPKNIGMPDFKDKHSILYCHECVECKLYFKSIKVLHKHKKDIHNLKPVYRCALSQCLNEFDKCDSFLEHSKIHQQRNIACIKCKIKFSNKNLLRHHMKNVHYNHKLKNSTSNMNISEIKDVIKVKDNLNSIINTSTNNSTVNKSWEFSCPTCGKEFENRNSLHNHIATHSTSDLRLFMCDICGHSFKTRKDLSRHAALHDLTKHKMCQECGMTFKTSFHLKRHTLTRHSNIRPFTCAQCEMTFARKDKLKQHEAKHINHPLYECKQCGKGFYRKEHLKDHEISKHSKQYPFSCEHCAKGFVHAKDLHRHIRVRHLNTINSVDRNEPFSSNSKKSNLTKNGGLNNKTTNRKLNNMKNQQLQQQQIQAPSVVAAAVAAMSGQNIRLVTGPILVPIQTQIQHQQQTQENHFNNQVIQTQHQQPQQRQNIINNQQLIIAQQQQQQQQQQLIQPIKTSISTNDFKCKKISSILKSTLYLSNQKQQLQLQNQQQSSQPTIFQQTTIVAPPQTQVNPSQTSIHQIQLNNFSTNTNYQNNATTNSYIINNNPIKTTQLQNLYKPYSEQSQINQYQNHQNNLQHNIINFAQANQNHSLNHTNQYFNSNNNQQNQILSIPFYSTNNQQTNLNEFNLNNLLNNNIEVSNKLPKKKNPSNKKLKLNDFQTNSTSSIDNTIDSIINSLNDESSKISNKCLTCNKEFSNENQLKKHIESKHNKSSMINHPFSCSLCSQQFQTKQIAKTHCEKSHVSFKCSLCSKSFKIKSHCRRHLSTVHSNLNLNDSAIIESRLDAKLIDSSFNNDNFVNYNNKSQQQLQIQNQANDLKDYLLNKDMNINLNDINLNFVDNIWTTTTNNSNIQQQQQTTLVVVNNLNNNENLVDNNNNHLHQKNNNSDVIMSNFFLA